jgi:hypothetical protein
MEAHMGRGKTHRGSKVGEARRLSRLIADIAQNYQDTNLLTVPGLWDEQYDSEGRLICTVLGWQNEFKDDGIYAALKRYGAQLDAYRPGRAFPKFHPPDLKYQKAERRRTGRPSAKCEERRRWFYDSCLPKTGAQSPQDLLREMKAKFIRAEHKGGFGLSAHYADTAVRRLLKENPSKVREALSRNSH